MSEKNLYNLAQEQLNNAMSLCYLNENVKDCINCGNFSIHSICKICSDDTRNTKVLCIVQDVADLWAMERSQVFNGIYHVLGNYSSSFIGIKSL